MWGSSIPVLGSGQRMPGDSERRLGPEGGSLLGVGPKEPLRALRWGGTAPARVVAVSPLPPRLELGFFLFCCDDNRN